MCCIHGEPLGFGRIPKEVASTKTVEYRTFSGRVVYYGRMLLGGSKCYCNTSLKLFRVTKSVSSAWSTSAAVGHFKKNHPHSASVRKQKGKLETRRAQLGECMHVSGSQAIQVLSSKKSPYGLSDNENDLMTDLLDTDMF